MDKLLQQHYKITELIEGLEDINWKESKLYNSDSPLFWLPVAWVFGENYCLGLSRSGYWVFEFDNQINLLTDKTIDMRGLLPCLKKAYYELIDLLEQGLKQKNLPTELAHTFPYQTLALFALKNKSDFWSSLALNWLNYIQIGKEVTVELEKVSASSWATQSTKQKASKLLRKLNLRSDQ